MPLSAHKLALAFINCPEADMDPATLSALYVDSSDRAYDILDTIWLDEECGWETTLGLVNESQELGVSIAAMVSGFVLYC